MSKANTMGLYFSQISTAKKSHFCDVIFGHPVGQPSHVHDVSSGRSGHTSRPWSKSVESASGTSAAVETVTDWAVNSGTVTEA